MPGLKANTLTVRNTASVTYALHGANANMIRPSTTGMVIWIGSVFPANSLASPTVTDLWVGPPAS